MIVNKTLLKNHINFPINLYQQFLYICDVKSIIDWNISLLMFIKTNVQKDYSPQMW